MTSTPLSMLRPSLTTFSPFLLNQNQTFFSETDKPFSTQFSLIQRDYTPQTAPAFFFQASPSSHILQASPSPNMLPTITVQAAQGMPMTPLRLGLDPPAPEMEPSPDLSAPEREASPDPPAPAAETSPSRLDPPASARDASRSPRKHARGRTNVSRHAIDNFITRMDKIEYQLDHVNDRFSHINTMLVDVQTSNIELGEEIKKSASSKPTNDARHASGDLLDLIKKLSAAADAQKSVDDLRSQMVTAEKTLIASIEAQTKRLDNYTSYLLQVEKLCRDDHERFNCWANELMNVSSHCRDRSDICNRGVAEFKVRVDEAFRFTYAQFNKSLHYFCRDMQAIRTGTTSIITGQKEGNGAFLRRIGSLNRRLYEMGLERGRLPEKGVGSTAAARLDYLDVLPPRLPSQAVKARSLSI